MSDSDLLASLRAEIKTWERRFREANNRDPSVEDVRNDPAITAKYKLYKKLSKSVTMQEIAKSRVVESTAALQSDNPFSPTKKTRSATPNHIASPSTPCPKNLSELNHIEQDGTLQFNHLYRARKRLRGEPVSPSPNKRQRTVTRVLSFQKMEDNSSGSEDNELPSNSSFVDDSPVKPGQSSRSFKFLFRDSLGLSRGDDVSELRPNSLTGSLISDSLPLKKSSDAMNINDLGDVFADSKHLPILKSSTAARSNQQMPISLYAEDRKIAEPPLAHKTDPPLLPPSPSSDITRRTVTQSIKKAEGKGKPTKQSTVFDSVAIENDMDDGDELKITFVTRTETQKIEEFDLGSLSQHKGDHLPHADDLRPDRTDGLLEVALSDSLNDVLDLSQSKPGTIGHKNTIASLLYGRREGHYHADKGGEIWNIGEHWDKEEDDGDDDWEGEPVSWEVGDL